MHDINVYLGKNQHTKDDEMTVTQATVRCYIPLPLTNHQTAPKSWVGEDAVIVLTTTTTLFKHCCCAAYVM